MIFRKSLNFFYFLTLSVFFIISNLFIPCNSKAEETIFDPFKNHLEFLGYQCEIKSGDKMFCKTSRGNPNFSLKPQSGGFLIVAFFGSSDKGKTERLLFLDFVNRCNQQAIATRFYLDKDTDLAMEVWMPGNYDKQRFGHAIDQFNGDWNKIVKNFNDELMLYLK